MVTTLLGYLPPAAAVHHELEIVKEAFRAAAIELREQSARIGATTVAEKLYWSTMALRAFRRGDLAACRWHCSIVPELHLSLNERS